nr:hypothetical protein [Corynebacterium riegelii]
MTGVARLLPALGRLLTTAGSYALFCVASTARALAPSTRRTETALIIRLAMSPQLGHSRVRCSLDMGSCCSDMWPAPHLNS